MDKIVVKFRNADDHKYLIKKIRKMREEIEEVEDCLEECLEHEYDDEYRSNYRNDDDDRRTRRERMKDEEIRYRRMR